MNDKSVKRTERLFLFATIIIFILIYFLKNSSPQFVLEKKTEATLLAAPSTGQLEMEGKNDAALIALAEAEGQENIRLLGSFTPQPYLFGERQERHLHVHVQLINKGETSSSQIRVEIPLLADLDSPYQVLLKESFNPEPLAITELSQGNRSALFNIPSLAPGESTVITAEYYLSVTPLTANLNFVADYPNTYPSGRQFVDPVYLLPVEKIQSDHPEVVSKAREITAGLKNDLEKAAAIFKFVINHVKYDPHSPDRNSGALSALRKRSGVCEDYAALFVALSRSAGIPARIVNGYADPQGQGEIWNIPAGKVFPLKGYRHSWAEFYLAGIGWVPVDPTMNIYDSRLTYFASLPRPSHLAQNYEDQNIRVRYQGGQLAVTWEEELAGGRGGH